METRDKVDALASFLEINEVSKVLLVTGRSSFEGCGAKDDLQSLLGKYHIHHFDRVSVNPKLSSILEGVEEMRSFNPDALVGVGGGSVMDTAKAISVLPVSREESRKVIAGESAVAERRLPMALLPTTAGSGSEATHFAVVYDDVGKKHSLAHQSLLPDITVLAPSWVRKGSARLLAVSGADALCQAVESIWGVYANEESLDYAYRAFESLWHYLPPFVKERAEEDAMRVCQGSHLAGKAINLTKTTAPHAYSYTLTSKYNVPHGEAVSLLLPFFVRYNGELTETDCADPRGADSVRRRIKRLFSLVGASDHNAFADLLSAWFAGLDLRQDLKDFQGTTIIEDLLSGVNAERLANNPRRLEKESIRVLFSARV